MTALMRASENGCVDVIRLLLENGCDGDKIDIVRNIVCES
jgi:ankyrin repeat protein